MIVQVMGVGISKPATERCTEYLIEVPQLLLHAHEAAQRSFRPTSDTGPEVGFTPVGPTYLTIVIL